MHGASGLKAFMTAFQVLGWPGGGVLKVEGVGGLGFSGCHLALRLCGLRALCGSGSVLGVHGFRAAKLYTRKNLFNVLLLLLLRLRLRRLLLLLLLLVA